jgi:hypothetical protein
VNDPIELLRRLLTGWYRQGWPWKIHPTLAAFRAATIREATQEVAALIDSLIARHGPAMDLGQMRLHHLLELR